MNAIITEPFPTCQKGKRSKSNSCLKSLAVLMQEIQFASNKLSILPCQQKMHAMRSAIAVIPRNKTNHSLPSPYSLVKNASPALPTAPPFTPSKTKEIAATAKAALLPWTVAITTTTCAFRRRNRARAKR